MLESMIRALVRSDTSSVEFAHLVSLASGATDEAGVKNTLERLFELAIIGSVEGGRVVAFAAYSPNEDFVSIEYIAVQDRSRGRGYGSALVQAIRERAGNRPIYAQTDDDAVGFYRKMGFTVEKEAVDARRAERQRYHCTLEPTADDAN